MADTRKHGTVGPPMSRGEVFGGLLYLPFYVFLLGYLLTAVLDALGLRLAAPTANLVYFLVNFLIIALVFHRWLIVSLGNISHRFWPFVQAIILGFVFYYALAWLLNWVLALLGWTVSSPNDRYIDALAQGNYWLMVCCTVLLAPLVEETLFRGLIFGNLHPTGRVLAYAMSALLFAALHVWQYVGQVGWGNTLLTAVAYLPAGVALGWTYEKADTIWAPIVVHSLINAVSMGILHG